MIRPIFVGISDTLQLDREQSPKQEVGSERKIENATIVSRHRPASGLPELGKFTLHC